jgi:hypothetical protein
MRFSERAAAETAVPERNVASAARVDIGARVTTRRLFARRASAICPTTSRRRAA